MALSSKWAGVVTAAGVLSLAAFGCGGSGGDGSDNASEDRAVGGGRTAISISINGEPGSLDPLMDADGLRQLFERGVYEGLVLRKGGELVPGLATSWEADGNSWIFHLRPSCSSSESGSATLAVVGALVIERLLAESDASSPVFAAPV